MSLVTDQFKILVAEAEDIGHVGVDLHLRRRQGVTGQLLVRLVQVVQVQVGIAQGVHEFARLQAGDLGHHQGEQGVGGDVEGNPQENVGAALVHLAGQGAVVHVELEERMAGGQGHLVDLARVPGADDEAARVGVGLYLVHHGSYLVYGRSVGCGPGAPLHAIDRAQFAVFIGPLVPDGNAVVAQVADVRFPLQKP